MPQWSTVDSDHVVLIHFKEEQQHPGKIKLALGQSLKGALALDWFVAESKQNRYKMQDHCIFAEFNTEINSNKLQSF